MFSLVPTWHNQDKSAFSNEVHTKETVLDLSIYGLDISK